MSKISNDNREITKGWSTKTPLENSLLAGNYGPPELRGEEKKSYLGEFKERVIKFLTKTEVRFPEVNYEVEKAAKKPSTTAIIVHGDLSFKDFNKYGDLAKANDLRFTVRNDPDFIGDIGLVVISDHAVH